jgi:hypothetical protein
MKEYVTGWTGSTEDADERGKRVELLKAIAGKLGVAPKFADLVPHAAKTVFFIERAKASGVDASTLKRLTTSTPILLRRLRPPRARATSAKSERVSRSARGWL